MIPKTARSQILGGVAWRIGMALGPVNVGVHAIDVILIEVHDEYVNPLSVEDWVRSESSVRQPPDKLL